MQDKVGNEFADFLVRRGAAQHTVDREFVPLVLNCHHLDARVQHMMLDILDARRLASANTSDQHLDESDASTSVDPEELFDTSSGMLADEAISSSGDVGEEDASPGTSSEDEILAVNVANAVVNTGA
eukprot:12429133-Karenia_brevis.AAC.1